MAPADDFSAVREVYDSRAAAYVDQIGTEVNDVVEAPLDQALLAAFVVLLGLGPSGPVADVGCGPGRAAAFVGAGGFDVVGLDLSQAMLRQARAAHPALGLAQALLAELPLTGRSLAGVVSWYSIIHTPPEDLGAVCAEVHRVLVAGGRALLAFQAGEGERVERTHEGTSIPLVGYRHDVGHVERCLTDVGFRIEIRAVREPLLGHETNPQAFLVAVAGPAPG